jgi:hypothetical protein
MKPYCVDSSPHITADLFKGLCNIDYEFDDGPNKRHKEEQAWNFFSDFLDECEDGKTTCQVSDILMFLSATDRIPPVGFDQDISVSFKGGLEKYITASTCDFHIYLPTCYDAYEDFRNSIIYALKNSEGFDMP